MNTVKTIDAEGFSKEELVYQINIALLGVEGAFEALMRISEAFVPRLNVFCVELSEKDYTLLFRGIGARNESLLLVFAYTEDDDDREFTMNPDPTVQYRDKHGNPFWIQ